jgi:hypothetical protein
VRRLLSDAVLVKALPKPSPITGLTGTLPGMSLTGTLPTESEVRDALSRVVRSLEDMRQKRGEGWEPGEFGFPEPGQPPRLLRTRDGYYLRGTLVIGRAD